jgi:HTH-type transcriptional regulator/antitoxin HigA
MRNKRSLSELSLYAQVANVNLLRSIESEESYERVLEEVDELAPRTDRSKEEDDYLMMLSLLLGQYEENHHAIDVSDLTGLEYLEFIMEESGMTRSDLGRLLGHRELGSKILRGERELSKAHILKLSEHFKVSSSLFLS